VEYSYEYVDLLPEKEKKEALRAVEKWNPNSNFPTLIIDNKRCIIGFREDEIKEALTE
jgi:glutaredoxin